MIFRINNNIASISAQRHLAKSGAALNKGLERLSSGLRINRAADDAAGLAVSKKMRAELAGLGQASKNTAQATTMIQTAEGGYNEIGAVLQRLKELAVQASDGSLNDVDRDAIEVEVAQQLSEIDRIANSTTFNAIALITGGASGTTFTFQVGAGGSYDQISINIKGANTNALASLSTITSANFGTAVSATAAIDVIDNAIVSLNLNVADIGAFQNRLERISSNLGTIIENTQAAESVIRDADVAVEVANMTRAQILVQAGVSMLGQANITPQNALALLP
jgi:flagellin